MGFVCQKGVQVGGRYELRRLLGEGGMGEVWAGIHLVTRRPVALKFLKGDAREEVRHRFIREARAASVVHHPNVVQMLDILELEDGAPVLVMDLLEGITLADLLARKGSLTMGEAAQFLSPVVSALGSAHAVGIVHRDLKPANIFLCERLEGPPDIRVLDFGVAKFTAASGDAAETAHLTREGEVLGTPYYMPPEQVFGEHDVDHRADIWSLGVILYECLAGKRPFEGTNSGQILKAIMMGTLTPLNEVAPRVPETVSKLVGRMLTIDKRERPADLREVLEVLRQHCDITVQSFGTARAIKITPPEVDPFSQTTLGSMTVPTKNRLWQAAVLLALVAIFAAVGVVAFRKPPVVKMMVVETEPAKPVPLPLPVPEKPAVEPIVITVEKKPARKKPPRANNVAVQQKEKLPGGVVDEVPF